MVKRIVLKVDVSCQKCREKIMQAISQLRGVDKIEIDAVKSTVTVTGDAHPIEVILRSRKVGKFAEVISIGPPPAPPKPAEPPKKTDDKKVDDKKKTEDKKADDKKKTEEKKPASAAPPPLPPLPPPMPILIHTASTCPVCHQIGVPDPQPSCIVM